MGGLTVHVLKNRQQNILNYLLNHEFPVTIHHMAKALSVSPRTVRYDLETIGYWLAKQDIQLNKVPKKGVWIDQANKIKGRLIGEASLDEVKVYRILTPQERQNELLGILFAADDRIGVGLLAEAVGVSSSTCYKDLDQVRAWLLHRGLRLLNEPHKGFRIKGPEEKWRLALIDYIEANVGEQQLMNLLSVTNRETKGDTRLQFMKQPKYHDMFSEVDLDRMLRFVEILEDRLEMILVDSDYAALMIHIAVAVKRLREGETIDMPMEQLEEIKSYGEYKLIKEILGTMTFIKTAVVPQEEIGYITAHVIAARQRDYDQRQTISHGPWNLQIMDVIKVIKKHGTIDDESAMIKALQDLLEKSTY